MTKAILIYLLTLSNNNQEVVIEAYKDQGKCELAAIRFTEQYKPAQTKNLLVSCSSLELK